MKNITAIIIFTISTFLYAEEPQQIESGSLQFDYFTNEDLSKGQAGCWYYYPANKKQQGQVLALGESANYAIYMKINGKKIMIGNWRADYQKTHHLISYSNAEYKVDIYSKILNESKYSSQFQSTITVKKHSTKIIIHTFGECGS